MEISDEEHFENILLLQRYYVAIYIAVATLLRRYILLLQRYYVAIYIAVATLLRRCIYCCCNVITSLYILLLQRYFVATLFGMRYFHPSVRRRGIAFY